MTVEIHNTAFNPMVDKMQYTINDGESGGGFAVKPLTSTHSS